MMTKKIAYFTDSHLGQKLVMGGEMDGDKMRYVHDPDAHKDHLRRVLDDIAGKGIAEVIFGGDIGARSSVADFFEILEPYPFETTLILGNHDSYGEVFSHACASHHVIDGKACFSQSDHALTWAFLDSSANQVSEDQLAWLARELRDVRKLALVLHHPILAIATPLEQAGAALRGRDALKGLLIDSACEVTVFCGHYHMADEAREANIRQLGTPAVSYQIIKQADRLAADTQTCGYRIVEIDGADIASEIVLLGQS